MTSTSLDIIAHYAGPVPLLLGQSDVLDVCVNPDGSMWVNRLGRGFEQEGVWATHDVTLLLSAIATEQECELNSTHPVLETTFPLTGDRIEGLIRPVVTDAAFAIRTKAKKVYTFEDFAAQQILTNCHDPLNVQSRRASFFDYARPGMDHLDILRLANRYRLNSLLAGPTGSGKTTFANGLMADWCVQTPDDRALIIEDTEELQCSLSNHVAMRTVVGVVDEAKLLKTTLRMIPKRIVVGEVRAPEPARVLLEAWNTGHSGGLATIHADDAISGLRKLETFLGSHDGVVRERIAAAIGLVIFIDGDERVAAGRKVRQVVAVRGFDHGRQDYDLLHL
jgi:type IV secretion system protein VirB11